MMKRSNIGFGGLGGRVLLVATLLVLCMGTVSAEDFQLDYRFNGTCDLTDYSGNNRDAACLGSPTTGVSGPFDEGWTFDGSSDGASLTDLGNEPSTHTGSYTFVHTFSTNSLGSRRNSFFFRDNLNLQGRVESDGRFYAYHVEDEGSEGDTVVLSTSVSTNTDTCVAVRYDGSNLEMLEMKPSDSSISQVDSASNVLGFRTGDNNDAAIGLKINNNDYRSRYWDGEIYDFKYDDSYFSNSKIETICQTGGLNTAPSIDSVSTEPSSWTLGSSINVSANVSDSDGTVSGVSADVWEDGTQIVSDASLTDSDGDGTWEVDNLFTVDESEVVYKYELTATDNKGATSTYNDSQFIQNKAPSITVNDPKTKTYASNTIPYNISVNSDGDDVPNETVNLTLDIDGSNTINVSVREGTTVTGEFTNVSEGSHTFNVEASDNGGSTSKSVSLSVDTEAPQIDISNPKNKTLFGLSVDVNFTVTDSNLDSCFYSIDGGSNQSLPSCGNFTQSFSQIGKHQITIYANDTVGNQGFNERKFTLDLKNEIRAEKLNQQQIDSFSASFDNLESTTDNGVIQFNTSQLSTGNNTLKLLSEGFVTEKQSFDVNGSFKINKTYTLTPYNITFKAFDESNPSKQFNNINLSVIKGSQIVKLKKVHGDYFISPYGSVNVSTENENILDDRVEFEIYEQDPGDDDSTCDGNRKLILTLEDGSSKSKTFDVFDDIDQNAGINYNPSKNPDSLEYKDVSSSGCDDIVIKDIEFVDTSLKNSAELDDTYSVWKSKGFPTGSINLEVGKTGYKTRNYKTEFSAKTNSDVKAFLLENSKGIFVEVESVDSSGANLPDSVFTLETVLGDDKQVVSKRSAGGQGKTAFFVNPDDRYTVLVNNPDYPKDDTIFSPSNYQNSALTIIMSRELNDSVNIEADRVRTSCSNNLTTVECGFISSTPELDNITLNVEKSGFSQGDVGNDSSNLSKEVLTVNGLNTSNSSYYFEITGNFDGQEYIIDTGIINQKQGTYGDTGVFMALLMFLSLSIAGAWKPSASIGLGILAVMITSGIGFLSLTESSVIALAALGAVLVWRMRQ